ncbi:MAG: cytochrome c oxidase assembly protein [Magnetovibrionaceae bacterium]
MADLGQKNARTALAGATVVAGMVGLSFASVPLYELFCQVTGFGGTPQIALEGEAASEDRMAAAGGRTIRVRLDANVAKKLPWDFRPDQATYTVPIGESSLAFYKALNEGGERLTGTATFNVTPHKAGPYFVKTQCFCFEEQPLDPGQSMDMPVSFFVDPEILDDPNTRDIKEITLSYTFFPADAVEERASYETQDPKTGRN